MYIKKLGHACKNTIPHEHKKNWNRVVVRFQFFVANTKKESEMFCPRLYFIYSFSLLRAF